jgi:hypothetical protein
MAILWLGFMSMFVVALGIPLVQRFIYAAGSKGLLRDIVGGFVTFILEVVMFTGLLTVVGYVAFGVGGALTLGVTGLTVSFVVVSILGTVSALRDPGMTLD